MASMGGGGAKVRCPYCWEEMQTVFSGDGFGAWHLACEAAAPKSWDTRSWWEAA